MARIIAGIVLYNPNLDRLKDVIYSIANEVEEICIFDNNSFSFSNINTLINSLNVPCKIKILSGNKNYGIGYALNRIFEYASNEGYDWVLTLDHDTICPANIISEYCKMLNLQNVGMICPSVIDKEIASNHWGISNNQELYSKVERCIQSGAMVKVNAWNSCKGFNEWMFIDFVDFDFCKRLELNDYAIIKNNRIVVDHELGARECNKHALFFEKLYKRTGMIVFKYLTYRNVFSPARVYYCTRNNIAYIKIYKNSINLQKEWRDFFVRIIKRLIRGKNRIMIIKETVKGINDGIKYKNDLYE